MRTNPPPGEDPWPTTRVVKTLWPPQAGTAALRKRFGARLVCVRYRHDLNGEHRYTTVELLVDHGPIRRPRIRVRRHEAGAEITIYGADDPLHAEMRRIGAKWNRGRQVWLLDRKAALRYDRDRAPPKRR